MTCLYRLYTKISFVFSCQEWDIDALEESTRYDGFKKTDKVIV